ncbi:MAG: hypothetical protein KJ077_12160 [Anaerolineae bacterium]|nr:hypothetical protein [Anaerolineae bacterium]
MLNVVCLFGFLYDLRFTIYDLRFTQHATRFTPHASRLWLATLAGLTLAVSSWHIGISRGDQRPLTVPLLAVLVFWFFLKGWTTGQKRWLLLSGLFLGLGFHTYSAARLLPLILLLAWLPEVFLYNTPQSAASPGDATRNTRYTSRFTLHASVRSLPWGRLTLLLLPALLVAAPMLWYFAAHPAQFSARAASVMIWSYLDTPGAILAELGRNLLRVLGYFCCAGSPNAIFGLPGYPGLSPLLAPFLLLGLIMALKNWRDLFSRLVALWWLIGISPSIIAIEAPHPLRMIVALPATAILVALGFVWVSRFTFHVLRRNFSLGCFTHHVSMRSLPLGRFTHQCEASPWDASRFTIYALPLLLILATLPGTVSAYFTEWTRLPVTQGIYDYGAVAIRDAVLAQASDSRPIYLPLARFNDPPLLFYLSGRFRREAVLSAPPAASALVISPEKNERDSVWVRLQGDTAAILPPLTAEGQQLIQAALAGGSVQAIQTPRGETVARLAALPTDPARFVQQPMRPLAAVFGPARLMGAAYPPVIDQPSAALPVTLYWQAVRPMRDDYEVILHLVDDSRRVVGDGTARPNDWVYPTTFWRPGLDMVAAQQHITLENGSLAPGRYWLAVALFDPAAGRRLPLTEGGSDSPDTFFIGPLKVPLPAPPSLPLPLEEGATFGKLIQLSGFRLDTPNLAAGEPVQLSLLWQALDTPPLDYTVFVHLLDAGDHVVAGNDTQPVNNTYPTSIWSPGERILDHHTVPTPASLPPGPYRLAIGLYYQPSGERLPLSFADGRIDSQGQLIVKPLITITAGP